MRTDILIARIKYLILSCSSTPVGRMLKNFLKIAFRNLYQHNVTIPKFSESFELE